MPFEGIMSAGSITGASHGPVLVENGIPGRLTPRVGTSIGGGCVVASAADPPPAETGLRVLIAEDEALIRLDLREMLSEEGFAVVGEAADGEQAVDLAEELKPDLV